MVGVASSALFDLTESQHVFDEHGLEAYRTYQVDNIASTLRPGVAFPFVQRLLALNDLSPKDPLVEVFVLSKNDPTTGLRVLRSVEDHGLAIKRAAFTAGEAPLSYVRPLNITLFLSGDEQDVQRATALDLPAGQVLGSSAVEADDGEPEATLRVAFDFDGVLADDEAERIWRDRGPGRVHRVRARATSRTPATRPAPGLPAGSRPDSGA
ncbi:MAG: 5'-nucleotidase [Cellulomonas sp.]|nr:5'-nucleotidase [Cellulomonas sp.]